MPRLNYSKLIHSNEIIKRGYSVKNSFYMQQKEDEGSKTRKASAYNGDISVLNTTHGDKMIATSTN